MALLVSDILARVASLLGADIHYHPAADLLRWVTDGEREICNVRPDASAVVEARQLAEGVKQSLPATAIRLLNVSRNMGADGATPGAQISIITEAELMARRPRTESFTLAAGARQVLPKGGLKILDVAGVRQCDPAALNDYRRGWQSDPAAVAIGNWFPDPHNPAVFWVHPPADSSTAAVRISYEGHQWRTDPASTTVEFYLYDERVPLVFYVHPPVPVGPAVYVEIEYTQLPTAKTSPGDPLSVGDWYANVLVDYVMYRALSRDPERAAEAPGYYNSFAQGIGLKTQADKAVSPNRSAGGQANIG